MRKRIAYLIMAGMLTFTGCAGIGTSGDSQAQAEQDDADGEFMPSSFVEVATGKDTFESYDEIISYLKKGQGYAKIKLKGFDGEILAITESVYADNNENHSIDVSVYGKRNGAIEAYTDVYTTDKEYPLATDGNVIYACSKESYEALFASPDGDGLMVKDNIIKSEDGTYSGFTRETNSFEEADTPDFTGGENEFKEYLKKYEDAKQINFKVVE